MPAKKPLSVIMGNGNSSHLTKAEIEYRKRTELKVPVGDVSPPDYLPAKLKVEFSEIAEKLVNLEIMTELDVDLLARYLLSKQTYLILTKKYTVSLSNNETVLSDKLSTMQDKAFKQCLSSAREMGLTITSRAKLVVPKSEAPRINKFDKFQKGGEK